MEGHLAGKRLGTGSLLAAGLAPHERGGPSALKKGLGTPLQHYSGCVVRCPETQ